MEASQTKPNQTKVAWRFIALGRAISRLDLSLGGGGGGCWAGIVGGSSRGSFALEMVADIGAEISLLEWLVVVVAFGQEFCQA